MALIFEPEAHSYTSQIPDSIKWTSATGLLHHFKNPFDPEQATKSSKNKKSPWFGMSPQEVQQAWDEERNRATDLGNYYHDQQERNLLSCRTITLYGKELPVIPPLYDEYGRKMASSQRLDEGIYPEHMLYLKSLGICGQSDRVDVANGFVHILDYKSNKEIKTEGYRTWEGTKKMLHVLKHLDDCNYSHYNLQLSLYMYMVLKHNPRLRPGNIIVHHVKFEEEEFKNKYGYPVHKTDSDGNPIFKELIPYSMPYLKPEVEAMLSWYHKHRP